MKILFGKPMSGDWVKTFNKLLDDNPTNYFMMSIKNINDVNEFIKKHNIDILFPIKTEDAILLSKHKFNCFCVFPTDVNLIRTLNDKKLFYEYCNDNKLGQYVQKIYNKDNIIYPAVAKPRIGMSGMGAHILNCESDMLEKYKVNRYLICEYIQGSLEYSANIMSIGGEIIYCLILQQQHSTKPYIKRSTMTNFIKIDNELCCFDDLKLIYKFLAYTGVTCVDFKICDGKLKIFEINPRFGGTVVKNNMIEPMIDKLCEIISK